MQGEHQKGDGAVVILLTIRPMGNSKDCGKWKLCVYRTRKDFHIARVHHCLDARVCIFIKDSNVGFYAKSYYLHISQRLVNSRESHVEEVLLYLIFSAVPHCAGHILESLAVRIISTQETFAECLVNSRK